MRRPVLSRAEGVSWGQLRPGCGARGSALCSWLAWDDCYPADKPDVENQLLSGRDPELGQAPPAFVNHAWQPFLLGPRLISLSAHCRGGADRSRMRPAAHRERLTEGTAPKPTQESCRLFGRSRT